MKKETKTDAKDKETLKEVIERMMTVGSMDELNAIVAQFEVQDEAVIITAIGKLLN